MPMSRASCWMMTFAFWFAASFLMPLDRRHRLGAIVVEGRHAVRIVVLVEVRRVAGQDHAPVCGSFTSRLWWPGVCPGVRSTITLPSPNTSLSSASGSTLPSPLAQFSNGL